MTSPKLITIALQAAGLTLASAAAGAQSPARPQPIPKAGVVARDSVLERRMLADTKAPAGFDLTLFAGPPVAMYPACLTESPDGAVFVCVDPNLSLSQMKGVGRVMRLVDTNGDGHADTYTTFAEMDSPRGIVSDGRTVFVMHPPFLTAYRDTNGDGIADESKDIVTGLGFDLDFRGADHTTNNIQLGIDGWIYVAVGDYGFVTARGTDGHEIHHRGGAVVRVRPDGTNLEIVATGTRNILDVALDPFARIFARDNTNDGDGWDTRLHYLAPGVNMGYPTRYQVFGTEHFPSLADYGAGAGVGSFWLQDSAWPAGYNNALYTGDWTTQRIYRHQLTPKGAIFGITQDDFLSVLRPADLILDGNSNLYVASLAFGQFNYIGDTVGYVVRVRPSGLASAAEIPVAKAAVSQLLTSLASGSAVRRMHAQQELLRRGNGAAIEKGLRTSMADGKATPEARVAAMFTLKLLVGAKSSSAFVALASSTEPRIRETALRLLADRPDQLEGVSSSVFVKALGDADAEVKVQAINGLVRLNARDAATSLVALTDTSDQAISHLAENALASLDASDAALGGIGGASTSVRDGSLRALAMMRTPAVVTALIDRLDRATDAATRAALVHTLGRLYNTEAAWKGDWWTTRPQHLGPYFDPAPWAESPRIKVAIARAVTAANGAVVNDLVADLARNQVIPRGSLALVSSIAASRDPLRARLLDAIIGTSRVDSATADVVTSLDMMGFVRHTQIAQMLAAEPALEPQEFSLAQNAVVDPDMYPDLRGKILTLIAQVPGQAGLELAVRNFSWLNPGLTSATPVDPTETAWRRFVGDRRRASEIDYFVNLARNGEPAQRTLAYAVLIQNVRTPARTPAAVRDKVMPALEVAWTDPVSAPSLAHAIGVMKLEAQYADKLAAYRAANEKK